MRRKGDSLSFVLVTVNYRGHRYTMHPHEFGSLPDPLVIIREDSYKAVCGRVTNGKFNARQFWATTPAAPHRSASMTRSQPPFSPSALRWRASDVVNSLLFLHRRPASGLEQRTSFARTIDREGVQ